MAENRASWLRLANQRIAPTAVPVPQAPTPTTAPAPEPPRILIPATLQPRGPTRTPAPPPAPTATPARAPSPTPAAPVKPQPPERQASRQTAAPPTIRAAPPPPPTTTTLPKTQPPSPSPPQRQAFQPAPPSPQPRTSLPAVAPVHASKSQSASPSPPPQLKGSPPLPQSPKTAHPSSPPAPLYPSPMRKPEQVVTEIVKNQVNPTTSADVKEVDKVVLVKNVSPSSRVAATTDSGKGNHTLPEHSKVHENDRVVPVKTVPSSAVITASEVGNDTKPQHSKIHGDGNSGAGLHKNRTIPTQDDEDHGMRIIAISGENNGATMEIIAGGRRAHHVANGGEKHKKEAGNDAGSAKKESGDRQEPVSAIVNSNVQSVNNSIMYGCNCSYNSPGVRLGLLGKPAVLRPRGSTYHHSSGSGN